VIILRKTALRPPAPAAAENAGLEPASVGELTVTGSRLKQVSPDGPTPVTVFSSEKIEALGASDVADVLRNLPQQSFSFNESYLFGGSQAVQLRGLGLGTTLVLLNGRRTVTSGLNAARNYFDLNTIPLSAVERIEVLSNGASAVYGADAVGGVVNVILKSSIARPTLEASYGAADGGAQEKRLSFAFGHRTERFRSAVSLDYFERDALLGSKRELTRTDDLRVFGGPDYRVSTSQPGNVYSTTGARLPGLTSAFAGIPAGSGVGLTPASFAATDGKLNLFSTSPYTTLVGPTQRRSASASVEYDLTSAITAFAEAQYAKRDELRLLSVPGASRVLVPATNPFNPFGQDVLVSLRLPELGPVRDTSSVDYYRLVGGARGKVGGWSWDAAALVTRDRGGLAQENSLNTAALAQALADRNPATAFNPFTGAHSDALRQALTWTTNTGTVISSAEQASGSITGPLFELPGGPVQVALGAEARHEKINFSAYGIVLTAARDAQAAFGELRAPLVDAAMGVPLVERLQLTLAGRYDHYSDFGGTFNSQVSAQWDVNSSLMFRASYGSSFRPPSLFELYQTQTRRPLITTDPRRGNETFTAEVLTAGNPNLLPETSDSVSAGFVAHPAALPNLRFSLDYWRIKQDQRVQRFTTNLVLLNESFFPERVVRAPPTPADIAAGRPGQILFVDATSINFGGVRTDGFDAEVDYTLETSAGVFRPSLAATYVRSFKSALLPGQPVEERAGNANIAEGARPHWKATASLNWRRDALQASTTARYTQSYNDADAAGAPTGTKVSPPLIVDAQVGLDVGEATGHRSRALDGLVVRVGAVNLFDRRPAISFVSGFLAYDPTLADLRQRFVYVRLAKTF
jgi:iron complex outermembrane receptor protein